MSSMVGIPCSVAMRSAVRDSSDMTVWVAMAELSGSDWGQAGEGWGGSYRVRAGEG